MSTININECLKELSIRPKIIRRINNYVIIETIDNNYLIKRKGIDKEKVFSYLDSVDCSFYLPYLELINDKYELYIFYDDRENDYSKGIELINALSKIHLKTMSEVLYTSEITKEIYDKQLSKIESLKKYYFDLQDFLDESTILRPDYIFLLKNISKFYRILDLSRKKLDDWYKREHTSYRESFQIQNVSFSNFIYNGDCYFIDFDQSSQSFIIDDIVSFYHNELLNCDIEPFLKKYFDLISIDSSELDLFYSYIAIPDKIELGNNCYENCVYSSNAVRYIDKTIAYILEKDKENEETNQQEFKE